MAQAARVFVLDTSAVIALLDREPEHERVAAILNDAGTSATPVLLPFIVLMEVEYRHFRTLTEDKAEYWTNVVLGWPVRLEESTPEWRREAALVKARGGLSLPDSWVAALALLHDAELVHKDPEFDDVPGLKAIRLPYDRDTGRVNA